MEYFLDQLTKREIEVLSLWAKGYTMKGIAQERGLSPRTVESYLQNIKQKTGASHKSDLVQAYHKFKGAKLVTLSLLLLTLGGCGFLGIHDQSFECPPEKGMACTSTTKVDERMDAKEQKTCSQSCGSKKEPMASKRAFPQPFKGLNLGRVPKRSPEKVLRVWMAPSLVGSIDRRSLDRRPSDHGSSGGSSKREAHHVYVVAKEGQWTS